MDEIVISAILITFGFALGMFATTWGSRLGRRRRSIGQAAPRLTAVEDRLGRLEDSVNTVALEMERIAEAHRFTARILTDRLEALPQHRVERTTTPH